MKKTLLITTLLIFFGLVFHTNAKENSSENVKVAPFEISWEIYPNPANDILYIKLKQNTNQRINFEIINFIGNPVDIKPTYHSMDTYRVDVSSFSNGYYYIIIKDEDNNKSMKKFLKR